MRGCDKRFARVKQDIELDIHDVTSCFSPLAAV